MIFHVAMNKIICLIVGILFAPLTNAFLKFQHTPTGPQSTVPNQKFNKLPLKMATPHGETSSYQNIWLETFEWLESTAGPPQSRVVISKAETIPGVISDFWRYTHQMSEFMRAERDRDCTCIEEHIYFVVPNCAEVGKYHALEHLMKLLSVSHQGTSPSPSMSCHLTHYHPNSNSTVSTASVCKRAPYPTLGIHLQAWPVAPQPSNAANTQGSSGSKTVTTARSKVFEVQNKLERLYNQPAAKSLTERTQGVYEQMPSSLPSTSMEALGITMEWINKRVKKEVKSKAPDPRVMNLGSIFRYSVSSSENADEAFADMWNEIEEIVLRANGLGCDNKEKKLIRPIKPDSGSDYLTVDDAELLDPCFSSLLILPNFNSFNAAAFKQFIKNLSALLGAAPLDEEFHIEIFHPEYVTANGKVEVARRMPYPSIHIYYNGLKDETSESTIIAAEAKNTKTKKTKVDYNAELFRQDLVLLHNDSGKDDSSSSNPIENTDMSDQSNDRQKQDESTANQDEVKGDDSC
mmetsp:Transcript_28678/g.37591  ORF Transcript_28678/g.37591 Transcript_28678/m.37591 type:complete len:519 (-) Transcript_28678:436-1992(-)